MWGYPEFIAKAKLYFSRAEDCEEYDEVFALWCLLGLEFLLRAPLARKHAALLAVPEGDSILHAVGIVKPNAHPKSVPTKTVVDRLRFVDPNFGEDRGKDCLFLADLRNGELHSADATLRNASDEVWLPKFLGIVEAVCSHLDIPIEQLLSAEIIAHANAVRAKADRVTLQRVNKAIKDAAYLYSHLTPEEIKSRVSKALAPSERPEGLFRITRCPACKEETGILSLGPGRTVKSWYNEESATIVTEEVQLANTLSCSVCGLALENTAEVMAAGIPRLHSSTWEEDRYEGWEEQMSYEDAARIASEHYIDDDYGND